MKNFKIFLPESSKLCDFCRNYVKIEQMEAHIAEKHSGVNRGNVFFCYLVKYTIKIIILFSAECCGKNDIYIRVEQQEQQQNARLLVMSSLFKPRAHSDQSDERARGIMRRLPVYP